MKLLEEGVASGFQVVFGFLQTGSGTVQQIDFFTRRVYETFKVISLFGELFLLKTIRDTFLGLENLYPATLDICCRDQSILNRFRELTF